MSYQALARKWRPKTFKELVGQEHVVTALTNALTRNRLHHAYLLTGTRGVGKTTIARIFAKSLNCLTNGVTAEPCGTCAACADIDGGRFVDLLELDAASNTGIDNMREVLDNARYMPTVGRYKVYLIDEVHMLSKAAFNSMLKTLEEPPEHVKFVLATTDPQKIPVTVLSRCLQFNLKQLSPARIIEVLTPILLAEGVSFDEAALVLIARAAHGSVRDALSLLDQAIAYGAGQVREDVVRTMLGVVDTEYVYRIVDALIAGDGPALLAEVDAMSARSISFASALEDLASVFHRLALAQTVPAALDSMVQRGCRRQPQHEMAQPNRPVRRRRCALTGPGVQSDVMVVPASRHEERGVPVPLHQIETERLDVELLGIRQMRDVQMHVSDPRVRRKTSPGVRVVAKLLEQGVNIQRRRTHLQPPADNGPLAPGTISIHLDAVSVRIGQVEGLADAVIGEALHRRLRVDETTKRLGQLESSRYEDGEVVKTCGAVNTYRRLRFCEDQEIWSLGAEPGRRILAVSQHEAKTRLIEVNGAIEIRDREVDRTDGGRGVYF